jgi:hypothetical protein
MKSKYLGAVFISWVVLWSFLLVRGIFIKDNVRRYRELLSRSVEGKRSYVTGDDLYEFLSFCGKNIPTGASYRMAGPDDESIERRRAAYYLYPHLEKADPDFILVYNDPQAKGAAAGGYDLFVSLDDNRYVMKKKGSR